MSLDTSSLFDNLELRYIAADLYRRSPLFDLFSAVMRGELDQSQLSALLVGLKIKGRVLLLKLPGAADAMRANALAI